MHVWRAVDGPIDIICGPLRPCVFHAELGLANPGNPERDIPGVRQEDGTLLFRVSAADVETIKTSAARLMLRTEHTLIPGSPDPRWGWRYTIRHTPGELTVTETGNPIPLDHHGYFNSALADYPDPPVVLTNKAIDLQ